MIYNQIVTWTAFAILAMFLKQKTDQNKSLFYVSSGKVLTESLCATKLTNISQASNFLQVGRAYELRNCSTFLTSFSELNLLRGERREQEKRRWEDVKNDKELTEGKPMEVLLTGDLHSEHMGHLPSAYQPTVLARVRKRL